MFRLFLSLPILLSACLKDETISGYADPGAVYVLREIDGTRYPAQAAITFPKAGAIAGRAPCNHYTAQQTLPYPWFNIDAVVATKRACPGLAAETAYFRALQSMTLVEVSGNILILSNDAGGEMVLHAK